MFLDRWRQIVRLRCRSLFFGGQVDRELDEELRYHIERQVEDHMARGLPPDEARLAALRAMGGLDRRKEECRDQRGVTLVDHLTRDFRYAARLLARSPLFTLAAVASLALGIGANAAIFQLIEALRLRSLPIASPHELAEIRVAGGRGGFGVSDGFVSQITYPLWEQIRAHETAFSGLFAWDARGVLVGGGAEARFASALMVSGDFFTVLGIAPERGRLFTASDDRRGCGAGPVVLSHAFWQRHFAGEDVAIGRMITILDQPFTLVGVTPATFTGLEVGRTFDIVLPLCSAALWGNQLDRRELWWLTVMGRLEPGWTLARASDELRTRSGAYFDATLPPGYSAESSERYRGFRLEALPAGQGVSRLRTEYIAPLWLLFVITGLVLLITCGNLATLVLARSEARAREMTIRVALGASRRRVLSQMLAESLLIAAGGAAAAVVVAGLSSRALAAFIDTSGEPLHLDLTPDWRVASFAGVVALLTALVFGLVPALRSSMVNPHDATRQGGINVTADRRRARVQRTLVIAQIAVSLVLVVSALSFVRSFRNLVSVETGFHENGLFFVQFLDLGAGRLPLDRRVAFQHRLIDEIRSTPAITHAAASTVLPLSGASWSQAFRLSRSADETRHGAKFSYVSPGYFETLGIPLLSGRDINDVDGAASRRVMVVNTTFVRLFLNGANPIGTTLRTFAEPGFREADYEVIGVVGDTKYGALREDVPPTVFVPLAQHPNPRAWTSVILRSDQPLAHVDREVRARVAALNPRIVVRVSALEGQLHEQLARDRMIAWLAGAFGTLAMALAAGGLYGVMAYLTVRRQSEIGVRLALGASRSRVVWLVTRNCLALLGVGLAVGIPASMAAMHGANSLLYGLSAGDIPTVMVGSGILAVVAVLAGSVPAWRAAKLDPTIALRAN